jgi:hypothetical protein
VTYQPARVLRSFDGGAHVYYYETLTTPPSADGMQGDWAVCLAASGVVVFGPKTDDTTWPAGAVNNGPTGPAGPGLSAWATATAYVTGQIVSTLGALYQAASNHTSAAAFRTDLATGKWTQVSPPAGGRCESADPAFMNSAAAAWPAANRVYYFRVGAAAAVGHVTVEVGTQSGNIAVGAYANNGSQGRAAAPATLLASSGSIAMPAAGVQQIALGSTVGVAAGDWLAVAIDNVTAKLRSFGSATAAGTNQGRYGYELLTSFPTMPATPAPVWAATYTAWVAGEA